MRPSVILFYIGLKHIFATWERKYAMFVMTYRFSMSHFNGSFCQFTFLYHHIFTWYEKWHFRFLKTWLIEHHHHIHAIFTKNCWAKYKDQRGKKRSRSVFKIHFRHPCAEGYFCLEIPKNTHLRHRTDKPSFWTQKDFVTS